MFLIRWHCNMPCHNSFGTIVNQPLINTSIGFIPFFHAKTIYRCQKMLVSFIHTISREMLNWDCHIAFICCTKILPCIGINLLRIIAICSDIGNWIMIISIYVNYRCKSPVNSFWAGNLSQTICIYRIICSCTCHLFSICSSIGSRSISSRF